MLYRVAVTLIVLFWIGMTTLLVRSELEPEQSRMRELPLSHVLKLLFLHQEPSELNIQYQKTTVGRLRLHPQVRREDGTRVIDFVGNAQFSIIPGASRERISWEGSVEMTRLLQLRQVRVGIATRGPERYRIEITHDAVTGKGRYEWKAGDVTLATREYSLDTAGRQELLREAQISPELITTIQSAVPQEPLAITARQATLDFQSEPIETSLVTFRQGAQTLLEVHISQLGQVLHADSILGYSFSAD